MLEFENFLLFSTHFCERFDLFFLGCGNGEKKKWGKNGGNEGSWIIWNFKSFIYGNLMVFLKGLLEDSGFTFVGLLWLWFLQKEDDDWLRKWVTREKERDWELIGEEEEWGLKNLLKRNDRKIWGGLIRKSRWESNKTVIN